MPNWFTYDWEVRGEPAEYLVDLEYDPIPQGHPFLLYCAVAPPEAGEPFIPPELSRMAKLEKKLLRLLQPDACYVGHIHMDTLRQYYLYLPSQEGVEERLDELILKEKKLSVQAGMTFEPDWTTYRTLLYPDAAKYQTEINAEMIEKQRRAGDAVEKVRRLTLYLCFPTDQDLLLFREAARRAGFAIGDAEYEQMLPLPHMLSIYMLSPLIKERVDAITTCAIRLAEAHFGELLRWAAPRVSRKNPLA